MSKRKELKIILGHPLSFMEVSLNEIGEIEA
jgi:hypothetical protein